MYIIVSKKEQGDKSLYPTTALVETYLKKYGQNDIIVCNPGYLSRTFVTIGDFYQNFKSFGKNNIIYCYNGMNGNDTMNKPPITILKYHEQLFGSNNFKLKFGRKDHSKFIFFLSSGGGFDENNEKVGCAR